MRALGRVQKTVANYVFRTCIGLARTSIVNLSTVRTCLVITNVTTSTVSRHYYDQDQNTSAVTQNNNQAVIQQIYNIVAS